jgi:hypothetical protein
MKTGPLHLLFGQAPRSGLLEDLDVLKDLKKEEALQLIDRVIEWYPREDIDKEWREWSSQLGEEETQRRKRALKLLLFIMREIATGQVSETEARSDIEKLEIPIDYFNYILDRLKSSPQFTDKVLGKCRPYENIISDVDWRIDQRTYRDGTRDNVAVVELAYVSGGEKEAVSLDINLGALRHLMNILRKVEDDLCQK